MPQQLCLGQTKVRRLKFNVALHVDGRNPSTSVRTLLPKGTTSGGGKQKWSQDLNLHHQGIWQSEVAMQLLCQKVPPFKILIYLCYFYVTHFTVQSYFIIATIALECVKYLSQCAINKPEITNEALTDCFSKEIFEELCRYFMQAWKHFSFI